MTVLLAICWWISWRCGDFVGPYQAAMSLTYPWFSLPIFGACSIRQLHRHLCRSDHSCKHWSTSEEFQSKGSRSQDLTSWNNPRDSFRCTCPSLPLLSWDAARWTQDCGLAKKTWRERLNGTFTILTCYSLSLPWLWCASDLFRTIAQSCMLHLCARNFEYAAGAQNKQCNNVIRKKYWDDPIPGTSII